MAGFDYALMNQMLYEGKAPQVKEMTEAALAEGNPVKEVLQLGLISGMSVVGEDFKHNRLYVPQVLIAARAMKAGMAVLKPLLTESDGEVVETRTIVMGTVKGDLHDIGKNLVGMMAEGAGYKIVDLGVDVSVEKFLEAIREHDAGLLGMSALLTTTMPYMKVVIDRLAEEGIDIPVAVGGAPVNEMFADEIGADGFAADAASAVDLFKQLYPAKVA